MKKSICAIAFLFLTFSLFSQVDQREVTVTNVMVPVKVFDGKRLVDNLTIEDFELYEDGMLQKIEALYLVQDTKVQREETLGYFNPPLSRHFDLLFQTIDYNPKFAEAIDYFFNNVFRPEDTLTIMTPMDNYNLSRNAVETVSKEKISKAMQDIVRKDTNVGSSGYRSMMRDLKRIVGSISNVGRSDEAAGEFSFAEGDTTSLELLFPRYREALQKMEQERMVDYKKFVQFAASRKAIKKGQINVFFFYQREYRPELSPGVLNRLTTSFQDKPQIQAEIQDLFQFYRREFAFNTERVMQAFADASITFNLIFMHKEPDRSAGISMREQSEDAFNAFSKIAESTGGLVDSSQNPAASFKNAVDNSQSYYILYYSPAGSKEDRQFKSIDVRLKNKNYKIAHRRGYFTN